MSRKHQQCIRQIIHLNAVIPTTIIMSGEHGRKYTVTVIEEFIDHTNKQSIVCENRSEAVEEIRQQKKNRKK